MAFYRIGDKLVDSDRIARVTDQVLTLRQGGLSQQDVADRLGIDRTFVSRLETLGEVRKGGAIAVVGFPVANKAELEAVARRAGVDFTFMLTEEERWAFLEEKSGVELFNAIMTLIARLREYQVVVILGHNQPARLFAALVEPRSSVHHLAQVPGTSGEFSPEALEALVSQVRT